MTYQHQELAAGRWRQLTFLEQMGNIGSEVGRALAWRAKGESGASQRALERALELLDLTRDAADSPSRLRELSRVRESLLDYCVGANEYGSSDELWDRYFIPFAFAARRTR